MLLFAIFIGISVDVGAIIMPFIRHALQKSTTIGLVNIHLIFGLYKEVGFKWYTNEEILHPRPISNIHSFIKMDILEPLPTLKETKIIVVNSTLLSMPWHIAQCQRIACHATSVVLHKDGTCCSHNSSNDDISIRCAFKL